MLAVVSDCRDSLVFGATGAVGAALVHRLLDAGARVEAVSRGVHPERDRLRWHRFDLYHDAPALPTVRWVFSAGPLDGFASWCRRQPPAPGAQVVALSSTSALSKRDSTDVGERRLARRLAESEDELLDLADRRGLRLTLLRPTLIYGGPGGALSGLARWAERFGGLPLPADAVGRRQPVHADDLASAMLVCAERPDTAGQILILPGGETLTYSEMVCRYLEVTMPGCRIWRLPEVLVRPMRAMLAVGPSPWRLLASRLARASEDLVYSECDWQRLGLRPRAFRPEPP